MKQISILCGFVLLAAALSPSWLSAGGDEGPWTVESVQAEAERLRSARRAAATLTDQIAPYYSLAAGRDVELYLLNLVTDPTHVEIAVHNPAGARLTLGTVLVEPNRHRRVSLRQLFNGGTQREFTTGSLWLRYWGDADSLQAWIVHRAGTQRFETALFAPEEVAGHQLVSFWSAEPERSRPSYTLLNVSGSPVRYTLETGNGPQVARPISAVLEAGAQTTISPKASEGWLRVSHEGSEGALFAAGALESTAPFSPLPVSPVTADDDTEHHAVHLPAGEAHLSLFNTSEEAQVITVERVWLWNGEAKAVATLSIRPNEVRSVVLRDLPTSEARLAVKGGAPFRVSGYARLPTGEIEDLAFFPRSAAHTGGTYPVPALADHEVSTLLVNLGDQGVAVVGQMHWANGSYAVGPLVVPPRGALRVDYAELAKTGAPDLLGQKLPASFTQGFFKWSAKGTGASLIARTQVRPTDGRDSFGFNCFGCCWQMPTGIVIPGEVDFLPGQTVNFTAAVNYETCNGTMGPYSTSPFSITSPWPFSWSGSQVSAAAAAYENLNFASDEIEFKVNCTERDRVALGMGSAHTCRANLRKPGSNPPQYYNPNQSCSLQLSPGTYHQQCAQCYSCCDQVRSYDICKKLPSSTTNTRYQTNFGNCSIDCA